MRNQFDNFGEIILSDVDTRQRQRTLLTDRGGFTKYIFLRFFVYLERKEEKKSELLTRGKIMKKGEKKNQKTCLAKGNELKKLE